ncbi:ABC transporter permease [Lysinibacillus sp. SGAir0095]|uniref:ABC transporter permease n=1 Tax=Lysinibacillus sp. SGAir0095 TaxID=2070463 RepID=UPI0010CD3CDE|nr:ABC transporter permease [Lysinibacillus sp. SGAir0095]QCR31144.1 ABC transporter permease [Lysinibacillus sp. SGAir0095]
MGNLLKTEWYKLRKDRSFWVLLLILFGVAVFYPLLLTNSEGSSGNDFYRGYILSINTDIVRLFPAILAGFFISSEYSMGTMKSVVSSGNSRVRLYFAKLTVFSIGSAIIMLILPIFMIGASVIYIGPEVMPDWSFYLKAIGLIALYAVAYASVMSFFSTIFTDSGKSIAFQLLFIALIPSLLEYLSSKVSFLESIISHSIFITQPSILVIDQIPQWSGDVVLTYIIVPILTFILFGVLGSLLYKSKEIK